eukprot:927074-Alexandrium_andersonii.AAC.1
MCIRDRLSHQTTSPATKPRLRSSSLSKAPNARGTRDASLPSCVPGVVPGRLRFALPSPDRM